MMPGPQARLLPDGRRLHLQHGPIDLILLAEGPGARAAHDRAIARFHGLLEGLVAELPRLRQPVRPAGACPLNGPIARRMWTVAAGFHPRFVTPMAGVAGAVAEAVLQAAIDGPGIMRACANNGGDIALHLTADAAAWRLGVVVDPARPASPGILVVGPGDACRGVATSGRHGRSLSLGIADSVTVLASDAPTADVAATLIANAVDLPGDPSVTRAPACSLQPDSDLGCRPVTTGLSQLSPRQTARALDAGEAEAEAMRRSGQILGAILVLQREVRIVGPVPLQVHETETGVLANA